MKEKLVLFVLLCLSQQMKCLEKELTINIDPGKEDCFYELVKQGEIVDFEYQVIDGGHGDLDITFRMAEPTGRIVQVDFKKSEESHRITAANSGDYKFCFDNTFSLYNSKIVFFELIIEKEDDDQWGNNDIDFDKVPGLSPLEVYELKVGDIRDSIAKVRAHLTKARQMQDLFKSFEARDRNTAEQNFFKVNTFSFVQIFIMLCVGLVQVVMVRSLFDDGSKVHKVWKRFVSTR